MIKTKNKIFTGVMVLAVMLTMGIGGCKKDSTAQRKTVYQLKTKDQLGVSGTVTFTEISATATTVVITLVGGDTEHHPAHIHLNSAVEGGAISISLNPVISGTSTTTITMLDNTSAINYTQLIAFDGYVNVHESATNLGLIIAQGDIGGNALTTTSKSYALDSTGALGVSGTALFEKRVNGNTLITIALNGTIAGGVHPAAIHLGSVTTVGGGPIVKTLNAVDGSTGKSYTNVRSLDDATTVSYDNFLVYDGYLAVTQSAILTNTLCQGNIGTH
jgi:hypothetical protein